MYPQFPQLHKPKPNADASEYRSFFTKNSKLHDNETRYTDSKKIRDSREQDEDEKVKVKSVRYFIRSSRKKHPKKKEIH